MTVDAARRYEFGWPEDRSVIAGLRPVQVVIAAAAVGMALGCLVLLPTGAGLSAAVIIGVTGAGLVLTRVGGQGLDQWASVAAGWATQRVRGQHRWRSAAPTPMVAADLELLPKPLRGLELLAVPVEATAGQRIGIVCDRRAGTYSAVLAARAGSFQLNDTEEKEQRLAGWGGVLAGLARAGSPVTRVQWVERTVPADGDEMGRWLADHVRVAPGAPSLASYLELVDSAGPVTQEHETFVVVSVSLAQARRVIRKTGGGDTGAGRVVVREVLALAAALRDVNVIVDGILTPSRLATVLRAGFDPFCRGTLARLTAATADAQELPSVWPTATEAAWGCYRADAALHVTYWVAGWPRTPVGPDFLAPLLLGTTAHRSVSVLLDPVDPARAVKDAGNAQVKHDADAELRTRGGWMLSAAKRRERGTLARREEELADGHRDYRVCGFVSVTAATVEELDAACSGIEQAASQAHLDLRRLYGRQDIAFMATLPLGKGLD